MPMHRETKSSRPEIPPGTLYMLILKTLARGPLHGYAIAQQIKRMSDDVLQVEEGSLYPALQRMLLKGWVTAEWVPAGPKRRARVYQLTPAGRKQLAAEISDFTRVMQAIVRVIEPA
jgi:PadR family transcriptional regulator PadR